MRTLYCYAIEYPGGKYSIDGCRLLRFRSRADRDAWESAGPDHRNSFGYREAVDSRHPAVRRARSITHRPGVKVQGEQWQPAANAWAEWIAV